MLELRCKSMEIIAYSAIALAIEISHMVLIASYIVFYGKDFQVRVHVIKDRGFRRWHATKCTEQLPQMCVQERVNRTF